MYPSVLTPLAVAGWMLTISAPIVSAGPTSAFDIFSRTPVSGVDVKALAPYLSANAKIYLPGTKEFATYTTRWSNLEAPTPNVVIAPGTEKDVQKIVSFAMEVSVYKQARTHLMPCAAGQVCQRLQHSIPHLQRPPWNTHNLGKYGLWH